MTKNYIRLCALFCISITALQTLCSTENPLITVLIMIKNEEDVMEKTLLPYLQSDINSYLVLDTGSTDNTIETTKEIFKKYNKEQAYVIEQPFVDFATSRNYLIEQAEQLFPDTHFFLMIDAEWYIHKQSLDKLIQFCYDHLNDTNVAYQTPIESSYPNHPENNKNFYLTRLFRPHCNVRFQYPVHEDIFAQPKGMLPSDIYFVYEPDARGQAKSSSRNKRDLELLLAEHDKHPNDLRVCYFLGQTYANLQQFNEARYFYTKVLEAPGCNTEAKAIMHYRIGILYRAEHNWEKALYHQLESYNTCSEKVEPLIEIAVHYLNEKKYPIAYLFALQASMIPYPEDHLFTEKFCYEYRRYCILGIAAWHMKQWAIGEQAIRTALEITPNNETLRNYLNLYEAKKQELMIAAQ